MPGCSENQPDGLQVILDALPQFFFHKDTQNNIIRANKSIASALGVSVSDLVGTPTSKWFPDEAGEYYKADLEVMASRVPQLEIIELLQMKGKQKHWMSTDKYPHFNADNEVDGILVFIHDITEQLLAEERKLEVETQIHHSNKLEGIGVLAAGVAHNFNNYLMSIVCNAELASTTVNGSSETKKYIDEILKTSQRAADECSQLLAYAGKKKLDLVVCSLADIVKSTKELLEIPINGGAQLQVDATASIPAVKVDPHQIKQLLINLVTNASEAMGECAGQITVATGERHFDKDELALTFSVETLVPGTYCFLTVNDTGSGMTKEVRDQIFQPFFTTKVSGHGLGLATVLGTVKSHRGGVRVISEIGAGTTIELLFPIVDEGQQAINLIGANPTLPMPEKVTVLLVEDDSGVRILLRKMLERAGFTVRTAIDGSAAIELFEKYCDDIQLVLLDIRIPKKNGIKVYAEISRLKPGLPVLFSSAYSEDLPIEQLRSIGCVDVLENLIKVRS